MKRKKNDWFLTVFLPSIFQRAGSNRSMWLTQKQTVIIVDNSEEHTARTLDADGVYYCNHLYYTGKDITGREYHMTYSKLNGCGYITFYLNDEEAEAQRIKNEQEQRTKKQERMIKRKANPERRAKSIERLKREIPRELRGLLPAGAVEEIVRNLHHKVRPVGAVR